MADEDKGFTVQDERRVNLEGQGAEKTGDGEPSGYSAAAGLQGEGNLPPVDFAGFLLGLGQMALIHLGEVPEPGSGRTAADLAQARHTIDLLDLLESKTRGNLTAEEESLLRHLSSDLKLRFVRHLK